MCSGSSRWSTLAVGLLARPALQRVKSWLLSAIHILDDGALRPMSFGEVKREPLAQRCRPFFKPRQRFAQAASSTVRFQTAGKGCDRRGRVT